MFYNQIFSELYLQISIFYLNCNEMKLFAYVLCDV